MKKLLLKIFLLVFFVTSIMLLRILLPVSDNDPTYDAAIIDKHKLLRDAKPPRIIFTGGSNLVMGLDSKLVENEIGIKTVNMGLNAGRGLRYMLSEVKPYIRKDDVIVIVPEYEHFFGTLFDGDSTLAYYFIDFPESRKYLTSWKQYLTILRSYPYGLRISLFKLFTRSRIPVTAAILRKDFNEYGDVVVHLNRKRQPPGIADYSEIEGEINGDSILELNNFKSYVEKTGAKVFFIYPCVMDVKYNRNEKKINLLSSTLKKELEIPILSAPSDYVFPEHYFYDTAYHLSGEGRKIRTQKVIANLKDVLRAHKGDL